MKNSKYTYVIFANDAIKLANGGEIGNVPAFIEKANDLIATQEKKKEYNATNPKKATAKGASEETKAKVALIAPVLPVTAESAFTADEINELLGSNFSALQVANAIKFIEGAQSVKVIRSKKNAKGLTQEKEYTAYFKA